MGKLQKTSAKIQTISNCLIFKYLKIIICLGFVIWNLGFPVFAETEQYRIKVENWQGGSIEVSTDEGFEWTNLGRVVYPTDQASPRSFAAAQWMEPGLIAATAVNAIHVKTGPKGNSSAVFSILPKEFQQKPKRYNSYFSGGSSIYTDISGGEGIFGGGFSPYTANVVKFGRPGEKIVQIPAGFIPAVGDTYYILVVRPDYLPKEIVFENRFGGKVIQINQKGEERIIGEVLRPVVGVGRFEGSRFASAGRIRANHPGVLDISTSPGGQIGGFQIVPSRHADQMGYVKEKTQWLVVGPKYVTGDPLEGTAPIFRAFIHPSYLADDLQADNWDERLLDRFLVEVQYQGKNTWEPMPILGIDNFYLRRDLPKWCDTALSKVSKIRILFPVPQ